jgi:transcriptional regulator with XRE-family HTH domain
MTQVEFAARLKVAPASIHRWESGTSIPEFEMIVSLWSLAIEHGSVASKHFAEFLVSRTEAIRPLFDAAQLPAVKALENEIAELAVDERHLVSALIRMLKNNSDPTAYRILRFLLEPWNPTISESSRKHTPHFAGEQAPSTSSRPKKPKSK